MVQVSNAIVVPSTGQIPGTLWRHFVLDEVEQVADRPGKPVGQEFLTFDRWNIVGVKVKKRYLKLARKDYNLKEQYLNNFLTVLRV